MADQTPVPAKKATELEQARVHVTEDNRVRVEFNIKELARRLQPGVILDSNCGGCRGCMGCSM